MSNDYDVWSESGQSDFGKLGDQIRGKLDDLSKIHARGKAKSFIGWINITTHPSQQDGIARDPTPIRNLVARLTSDLAYPAVVCFYGGFELARPLLLPSQSVEERFG